MHYLDGFSLVVSQGAERVVLKLPSMHRGNRSMDNLLLMPVSVTLLVFFLFQSILGGNMVRWRISYFMITILKTKYILQSNSPSNEKYIHDTCFSLQGAHKDYCSACEQFLFLALFLLRGYKCSFWGALLKTALCRHPIIKSIHSLEPHFGGQQLCEKQTEKWSLVFGRTGEHTNYFCSNKWQ